MANLRAGRALCAALTTLLVLGCAAQAEQLRTTQVTRVIDGDTFVIAGGERVRVRNFDTPELRNYDCSAEREAAVAARRAARRLLNGQTVTLRVDGRDRYRRVVADVTVHRGPTRQDFAARMVAEGHGKPWNYGHEPQPDWCAERPQVSAARGASGG